MSVRGIAVAAAVIAGTIGLSALAALAVTHLGNGGERAPRGAARPGEPPPMGARVPLQTAPQQDIAAFLADKRRLLEGYGWVDRQHGVARIPIERAMALRVQQARTDVAKP